VATKPLHYSCVQMTSTNVNIWSIVWLSIINFFSLSLFFWEEITSLYYILSSHILSSTNVWLIILIGCDLSMWSHALSLLPTCPIDSWEGWDLRVRLHVFSTVPICPISRLQGSRRLCAAINHRPSLTGSPLRVLKLSGGMMVWRSRVRLGHFRCACAAHRLWCSARACCHWGNVARSWASCKITKLPVILFWWTHGC